MRSSSIWKQFEVVFHLKKNMRSSSIWEKKLRSTSIWKKIEVVFHLRKNWGRLPFEQKLKVVFHLKKKWGCLPNRVSSTCTTSLTKVVLLKMPFWYFSGRLGSDDGNSDNRANSAQVQMNLPTRAELGNIIHGFTWI